VADCFGRFSIRNPKLSQSATRVRFALLKATTQITAMKTRVQMIGMGRVVHSSGLGEIGSPSQPAIAAGADARTVPPAARTQSHAR
jgi:hypothetical protein